MSASNFFHKILAIYHRNLITEETSHNIRADISSRIILHFVKTFSLCYWNTLRYVFCPRKQVVCFLEVLKGIFVCLFCFVIYIIHDKLRYTLYYALSLFAYKITMYTFKLTTQHSHDGLHFNYCTFLLINARKYMSICYEAATQHSIVIALRYNETLDQKKSF